MTKAITAALLLLTGAAAVSSANGVAGVTRDQVSGDFTLIWNQRVDDPAATTQPSLSIGAFTVDLRPAPNAKPKDPPAFQVVLGDGTGSARSQSLVYPGKPYEFALVRQMGGPMQLYVNGFPDGPPLAVSAPGSGKVSPAAAASNGRNAPVAWDDDLVRDAFRESHGPVKPIVTVAHRGVHKHAPENTRVSYVQAVAAGAPILEFDTGLTSDGHIVGMHDETVDRTTDGAGKLAELTLEQVRKLDAGSWKDPKYKGERVPTIDEIAEVARKGNAILMLDLKAEGQGAAIAKWLETTKYPHDQVIVAPWEDREAVALRKHVPMTVPMIRLTSRLPTTTADDAYFEKMKSIGLSGFSVNWKYLTDEFTRAAQRHGMKVYTWTLNDPPDIAGAALLGVDGVITDDPAATIKLLSELQKK